MVVAVPAAPANKLPPGVYSISGEAAGGVYAMVDGTVVDTVSDDQGRNFDSLGYMVIVKHSEQIAGKDTYSAYFHMNEPPSVGLNEEVIGGLTQLGVVGDRGAASGCHLHLEIRHFSDRFLADPGWDENGNIYGTGDRTNSTVFLNNWENPEQLGLELQ